MKKNITLKRFKSMFEKSVNSNNSFYYNKLNDRKFLIKKKVYFNSK